MPAMVDDNAVTSAAQALLAAAMTIRTSRGLKIIPNMSAESAKRHVMCALVFSLGHYAHSLQPTDWVEMDMGPAPTGALGSS